MRVISFLKVPKELEAYFGIILVFFEMRRNQCWDIKYEYASKRALFVRGEQNDRR